MSRSRLVDYDLLGGAQIWPTPPMDPSPFEMAAASELQRRVELALASLPGVYREALLLVAFEGFTPSEAARANAVTVAMLWASNVWHALLRMMGREQQPGRPGLPVSGSARS